MKKLRSNVIFNIIAYIYIAAWILLPAFRGATDSGLFRIIFVLVALIWILTSFLIHKNWMSKLAVPLFISLLYPIIMGFYYIFGNGNIDTENFVQPFFIYLMIMIGAFYLNQSDNNIDKVLIRYIVIFFLITAVSTLYNLSININVARILTSSSTALSERTLLESRNVGSFDFIYGSLLVLPFLVIYIKNIQLGSFQGVLSRIGVLLIILLVVMSNFTTGYIFLMFSILIFIIPSRLKLWQSILLFVPMTIICMPLIIDVMTYLLLTISNTTPSILMQMKINQIIQFIEGGNRLADVSVRFVLLENSMSSFLRSPIIGVGAYYGATNTIGDHSQFVDDLARYGVLANAALWYLFYFYFKMIIKSIRTRFIINGYKIAISYFVILGLLNPVYNYGILFTMFVVIPLLAKILERLYCEANVIKVVKL